MRLLFFLILSTLARAGELDLKIEGRDARVRRSILVMRPPASLETTREWERIEYFAAPAQLGYGVGLFGLAVLAAAHAPRRLRGVFEGRWHLGPAVLDGNGLGIGFGGRL